MLTSSTIQIHDDCRVALDVSELAAYNEFNVDHPDHMTWARNASLWLFADKDGLWLLPDDDCPFGNGCVLPLDVLASGQFAKLLDGAFCCRAADSYQGLINHITMQGVTIDAVAWDRDDMVTVRTLGGDWVDLDSLDISQDEFVMLVRSLSHVL